MDDEMKNKFSPLWKYDFFRIKLELKFFTNLARIWGEKYLKIRKRIEACIFIYSFFLNVGDFGYLLLIWSHFWKIINTHHWKTIWNMKVHSPPRTFQTDSRILCTSQFLLEERKKFPLDQYTIEDLRVEEQ